MTGALVKKCDHFAISLKEDIRVLFNFLYGTPQRSRMTVLFCLMIYAYYATAVMIGDIAHARGVCGF